VIRARLVLQGAGLVVALALAGCASFVHEPPPPRDTMRLKTFPRSFDHVWGRAVDWFAENNVILDKVEKTSGLLSAKYRLAVSSRFVNCGKVETSGTLGGTMHRTASVNVTVRERGPTEVRVNINVFGEFEYAGLRDAWNGAPLRFEGRCESTGLLEASFMQFVGQ
jgi:hypothetical protein